MNAKEIIATTRASNVVSMQSKPNALILIRSKEKAEETSLIVEVR